VDQEKQARRSVPQLTHSQRGWVGLVVVLIALVIVALLAQTALKSYGLLPGPDAAVNAGPRGVGAVGPAPADPTVATPAPVTPIERAHGMEQQLQRDAQDLARRVDESTK
jgi:cytochrome c-type biogenesis protein CcmH/NrfG